MDWYEINARSSDQMVKIRNVTKEALTVRHTIEHMYIAVPEHEYHWLENTLRDIGGVTFKPTEKPEWTDAACGIKVIPESLIYHQAGCKSCRSIRGIRTRTRQPRIIKGKLNDRVVSEPVTLFKLPGLQEFSLNGVLEALRKYETDLMNQLERVETAIKAISELDTINSERGRLNTIENEYLKALTLLLKEKGYNIE